MKRIISIWALAILLNTSFNASYGQKIHAIVFCNTLDSSIGVSCANDHDRFINEMELIASALEYQFEPISAIGQDCSKEKLETTLTNLNSTDKDIIFFYYSGHGAHAPGDNDLLPQMCLKYRSYEQSKWVPVRVVNELVSKKPASLRIIMTDCCNNISDWVTPKGQLMDNRGDTQASSIIPDNYKKLFVDSRGNLILTSSKKGQVSYGPKEGGTFSISFWDQLMLVGAGKAEANWDSILNAVKRSTLASTNNKQEPYYSVNINNTNASPSSSPSTGSLVLPIVVAPSDSNIGTQLQMLINTQVSLNTRVESINRIADTYFSQNAQVAVVGRNLTTVVEYLPIREFLRNICMAGNLQQINIIREMKDDSGKTNYIKVHEVVK